MSTRVWKHLMGYHHTYVTPSHYFLHEGSKKPICPTRMNFQEAQWETSPEDRRKCSYCVRLLASVS